MSQSPPLVTVGTRMQDVGFQTQGPFCSVCRRPGEAERRPLLREGEDGRGAPGSGPKGGHRAQSSQPEFWASAWSPREPLATPWGLPGGLSQEETCSPCFLHVFQRPAGLRRPHQPPDWSPWLLHTGQRAQWGVGAAWHFFLFLFPSSCALLALYK